MQYKQGKTIPVADALSGICFHSPYCQLRHHKDIMMLSYLDITFTLSQMGPVLWIMT